MANIEEVYRNLTNVDFQYQHFLWDERGKGYYGEFLVFREIYPYLPGNCKILMNINIPTANGKTTEIDLLLIHETGFYVFEIKHYKGTIYGKPHEAKWTQYFRTAVNKSFRSPVEQNQYHIAALQNLFPKLPIHSFIVFTNPECDLRVQCHEPNISICRLSELKYRLNILTTRPHVLDLNRIDVLFQELLPYAPIMQKNVVLDEKEIPFYAYIGNLSTDCNTRIKRAEDACSKREKSARAKSLVAIISSIVICTLFTLSCAVGCVVVCTQYHKYSTELVTAAQKELATFARKFEHVKPYNDGNITLETGFVEAFDLQLEQSTDVKNAVNLQFSLKWNGEYYGAKITRNTKVIVILKDGSVKEYDLLESAFPGKSSDIYLGVGNVFYSAHSTWTFPIHELAGVNINDISYIKLSGLDIWVQEEDSFSFKVIGTGYEVLIAYFPF